VTPPHLAGHPPAASQQAIVDAALLMLQQMGLSPGDLVTAPRDRPPVPTFAEYVPVVSAAVTDGTRRAVTDDRLAEICQAAATGGDDPELDTLLLRLHTETACRRGGALALRPDDLDSGQCLIRLREKGETVRWQPVSPTLMARLIEHGQERHAPPGGQLLRYRNGQPITSRRYDGLWLRIGRVLPWVRTQQISMHWIRHTTLTWVERNFGYAVARAYAGHTDRGSDAGATTTYVRATPSEVATALSSLTGEPHPLSMPQGGSAW